MNSCFNRITPVALVDSKILGRNIRDAASFAEHHGLSLRPHIKTHKCPNIACLQRDAGAAGITCATIDEAIEFAEAGFQDIFIAYPIVGGPKCDVLKKLCRLATVIVSIDNPGHLSILESIGLPEPLKVRIEIDSGHHRCGLPPGPSVVELARIVSKSAFLALDGVFTHAGHVYASKTPAEIRSVSESEGRAVIDAARMIREAGIRCPNVSVGSTPTWRISALMPGVTEARPGNYVYNDAIQIGLGVARPEDCAFTVLTTVVAVYGDHFVVDAGSKALGLDKGAHGVELLRGYGIFLTADGTLVNEWIITRLSEEHGIVPLEPGTTHPRIGDRFRIIPNHSCASANMYSSIYMMADAETGAIQPLIGRHR